MARRAWLPIWLLAAGACASAAQTTPKFDGTRAFADLKQMVAYGPRPAGSKALEDTRTYIRREMAAIGLTLRDQTFTTDTPVGQVKMTNLIGTLPGRRPERILFTGHYDTKPMSAFRFVGASDGASSGAFLMELARALKSTTHEFTYEFVWFDGEEAFCLGWDECAKPGAPDNTYGSRYYVTAGKNDNSLKSIKAMILVDMIGAKNLRMEREAKYSAKWLNDILWNTARRMGLSGTFVPTDTAIEDDHQPFFEAGVDCADLIDLNDYPEWHTAEDNLDRVEPRSLQVVGDVVIAALADVEKYLTR